MSNKIDLPAGHVQVLKYLCACLSPVLSQEGEAFLGQPELSPGWATDKKAAPPLQRAGNKWKRNVCSASARVRATGSFSPFLPCRRETLQQRGVFHTQLLAATPHDAHHSQ